MEIKTAPNPTKVATKWALINLLAQIIFTYIMQFGNLDQNGPVKWVGTVMMIAFLFLAQKEFKDSNEGLMTFSQGFSTGFRYAVFGGLLVAVFIYVYYSILSPDVFSKMLELQRPAMEQKGLTVDQVDKQMAMARKIGPIAGAFVLAIIYAIVGAIVGLIGAAIFKKEKSAAQIADELDNTTDATA